MKLSVVIPMYNESEIIADTVEQLHGRTPDIAAAIDTEHHGRSKQFICDLPHDQLRKIHTHSGEHILQSGTECQSII